jgi:hypothetical protein
VSCGEQLIYAAHPLVDWAECSQIRAPGLRRNLTRPAADALAERVCVWHTACVRGRRIECGCAIRCLWLARAAAENEIEGSLAALEPQALRGVQRG